MLLLWLMLFTLVGPCAGSAPSPRSLLVAAHRRRLGASPGRAPRPADRQAAGAPAAGQRGRARPSRRPGRSWSTPRPSGSAARRRARRRDRPPRRRQRPAGRRAGDGRPARLRRRWSCRSRPTRPQKKLDAARDDVRHSAVLLYQHGDGADDDRAARLDRRLRAAGRGQALPAARPDKRQDDAAPRDQAQGRSSTRSSDARRAAEAGRRRGARGRGRREGAARRARRAAAARARRGRERGADRERHARRRGRAARRGRRRARRRSRERIAAQSQSAGDGPSLGDGTFIRPVPGPITSGFGYRTDPVTGATAFHAGIDIGASCGTPIKAAGTGVVLSAGFNSGGYGNMTLINHGNGHVDALRPPVVDHRVGRPVGDPGPGDRLRGLDRQVDRVPPALRGARRTATRSTRRGYL